MTWYIEPWLNTQGHGSAHRTMIWHTGRLSTQGCNLAHRTMNRHPGPWFGTQEHDSAYMLLQAITYGALLGSERNIQFLSGKIFILPFKIKETLVTVSPFKRWQRRKEMIHLLNYYQSTKTLYYLFMHIYYKFKYSQGQGSMCDWQNRLNRTTIHIIKHNILTNNYTIQLIILLGLVNSTSMNKQIHQHAITSELKQ